MESLATRAPDREGTVLAAGLPGSRGYVATRDQVPPEILVVHTYYWEFSGPYLGRGGLERTCTTTGP